MFRSAAYAFGPRVIGVVLTGALDDGTAGLWSIKDRGGIAIVQDPEEAENPSMPASAKQHVEIDYCIPIAKIAETLIHLTGAQAAETEESPASKALEIETRIAFGDNPLKESIMSLGEASAFTCPECHGALIEITNGKLVRFRCNTGHAFQLTVYSPNWPNRPKILYGAPSVPSTKISCCSIIWRNMRGSRETRSGENAGAHGWKTEFV